MATRRRGGHSLVTLIIFGALGLVACAAPSAAPAAPATSPPTAPAGAATPLAPATVPLPTAAGAPVHVTFANTPGAAVSSPVYIAIERGYFQQVGLDVELVNFAGGGAAMIPSIAASQVDIANTDAGAGLLNAISRDLPMKFVADGSQCNKPPCQAAFLVRKSLVDAGGFKTLADLKGKKLNTFTPGSSLDQLVHRMLDQAGLSESDVDLQNVDFGQVLPALSTGALDASWDIEPFVTQGVAQGIATRFADSYDLFGPTQGTEIVYAPTFAAHQPEVGKRFMVAYLRGVRDYLDAFEAGKDRDAIVAILTKDTSLQDPALYEKVVLPGYDPNGTILLQSVKNNQQWYVDHGYVKVPVDLDAIYDQSYQSYALSVLGKR